MPQCQVTWCQNSQLGSCRPSLGASRLDGHADCLVAMARRCPKLSGRFEPVFTRMVLPIVDAALRAIRISEQDTRTPDRR